MTGLSPFDTSVFNNSFGYGGPAQSVVPINKNTATLAQILKDNGLITAAFINTESLDGELTKMNKGFDVYNQYPWLPRNGPSKKRKYKSYLNIEAALKWLDNNKDKRFFLWVHLMEPHAPYYPTNDFHCKFNPAFCDEIENRELIDLEKERAQLKGCQPQGLPEKKVELFKTLYDGQIGEADLLISDILKKIQEKRIDKKTIVVFYGDHGEGFDHNFYFYHNLELYNSFVKIPFIVKYPLAENKGKIDEEIQNSQIFPTLLELMGITYSKSDTQSIPFTSLFYDATKKRYKKPSYLYFVNSNLSKYAIQHGEYKYIFSIKEYACLYNNWVEELYDVKKDFSETKNIIAERPDVARDLKARLLNYLSLYQLPDSLENVAKKAQTTRLDKDAIEKFKTLGY
jgi:arylsulfatase A-like enzyme